MENPLDHFRVLFPEPLLAPGTCGSYLQTSRRALLEGCLFATNGGPFSMHQLPGHPTCLGNIVSDGVLVQALNTTYANFGITKGGQWVMGEMTYSDVHSLDLQQLLTGFGWLVREGVNQVTTPGGLIAPRTAIGVDKEGHLLMFEADGVEDLYMGLTLEQLAEWMMDLGAYNAINLDGGGSSVAALDGFVISHPTCTDTGATCERFVTTMTCVMGGDYQ